MNPTVASRFDLTTDFPLDKIIYMETGSFTATASSLTTESFEHGLTFTPLMDGTWSPDSLFDTTYDIGAGPINSGPVGVFEVSSTISADSTHVYIDVTNFTGSNVTYRYRVFGLMPSNVNSMAPVTSIEADDYVFNTDFNYTKLFEAGYATVDTTVTHALGHRPQVVQWRELTTGRIYKVVYADPQNSSTPELVRTTTEHVFITFPASSGSSLHYRIYVDE